jgi:hypothetical protein
MLPAAQLQLPRNAWSMIEKDLRQLKAMALLDYVESKQAVAILWEQISEIGNFLRMMGEDLKTDPSIYAQKEYIWPSQKDVDNLVKTLAELEEKMNQSKQKAMSIGVSL